MSAANISAGHSTTFNFRTILSPNNVSPETGPPKDTMEGTMTRF
jgi:hypothetical protein